MALSLQSVIRYIPVFGDQRKGYEQGEIEDPVTFYIQVMGAMDFRVFAARLAEMANKDGDKKADAEITALYDEVIAKHVQRIENLDIDGLSIATGEAFYRHRSMPNGLVMEIERAIIEASTLSVDDEKK